MYNPGPQPVPVRRSTSDPFHAACTTTAAATGWTSYSRRCERREMKRAGLPVGRPARCNDRVACAQAARRRCNTSTISAISPGAAGSIVKPTLTSIGLDDCDTQERSITAVNEDVSKWGDGFTADVMSTSAWYLSVLSTAQRCTAVPLGSVVVACVVPSRV